MVQLLSPGLGALHPKSHNAISGLSFTANVQNQLFKSSFQKWIGHLAAQESLGIFETLQRLSSQPGAPGDFVPRPWTTSGASFWGPLGWDGFAETFLLAPHFGMPRCEQVGPSCAVPGQAGSRSLAGSAPQKKTDYILYIRLCGIKHCWIWKANYFSGRAYRIFFPLKSLMTVFMGKFPWVPPRLKAFFMRQMEMFFPRVSNI